MSKDLVKSTNDFDAVISIIENAKGRALKAVKAELINVLGGWCIPFWLVCRFFLW